MSDYLPEELCPMILLKLPVKSMVQFTSVCKNWYSLITSSSFISAHLSVSRRRPLLLTPSPKTQNTQRFSLLSNTDPFPISRNLRCPFVSIHKTSFSVVGSLHGLICLADGRPGSIIIWNPSIQKSVQLPMPSFDRIGSYDLAFGFGFDSAKNDYKVVRVAYLNEKDDRGYETVTTPPLVKVCSLRERSWKPVSAASVEYCIPEITWSQCFIHGAVHWSAWKWKVKVGFENVVLLFDLENEIFKTMKLPLSLESVFPTWLSISVIGGLLSVFESLGVRSSSKISIWVKMEYGEEGLWTKTTTIENWEVGLALHLRRVNGEILLESGGGESLECESKDLQLPAVFIASHCVTSSRHGFFAFSYPKSLVLLDKESGADSYTVPKDGEGIEI